MRKEKDSSKSKAENSALFPRYKGNASGLKAELQAGYQRGGSVVCV
jgi:hypothetical protein